MKEADNQSVNSQLQMQIHIIILNTRKIRSQEQIPQMFVSGREEQVQGLRGRNLLSKNYSCYFTRLESWHTHPLVLAKNMLHKNKFIRYKKLCCWGYNNSPFHYGCTDKRTSRINNYILNASIIHALLLTIGRGGVCPSIYTAVIFWRAFDRICSRSIH